MLLEQRNSKKQGDVGMGAAIYNFSKLGYTVSIPITDNQEYDLVVDDGISLKRIQVKTTRFIDRGFYIVHLRTNGGNMSGTGKYKLLDKNKVDAVFVLTAEEKMYLIPVEELGGISKICLVSKYDK